MKSSFLAFVFLTVFTLISPKLSAQDNCCGMGSVFSSLLQSGIFGGYGFQQFSAQGWNDYVSENLESENVSYDDFGFAHGWLVGANLIQIRHEDLLVGIKFYYQSLTETKEATGFYNGNEATQELEVKLNNWNLGMSLSYILSKNFDYRIADVYMSFPSPTLTNEIRTSVETIRDEYESSGTNIGFAFDTGIVFYPAPPYVSVELIGGYSFFTVESMNLKEGGAELILTDDFIDGGGFFANAVLTIGIPFN